MIGSIVAPNQLSEPNMPTMIDAMTAEATSTVKVLYMKMKQISAMQRRVASADCHMSVGI